MLPGLFVPDAEYVEVDDEYDSKHPLITDQCKGCLCSTCYIPKNMGECTTKSHCFNYKDTGLCAFVISECKDYRKR